MASVTLLELHVLQKHVVDGKEQNDDVFRSVTTAFYVDNCLDSVTELKQVLAQRGFNIQQWANNVPSVIENLPPDARSELWLNFGKGDSFEATLGLQWQCDTDELRYKCRPIDYDQLTKKVVYRILASQYDPIGFLWPYLARAKYSSKISGKHVENWTHQFKKVPSLRNGENGKVNSLTIHLFTCLGTTHQTQTLKRQLQDKFMYSAICQNASMLQ